MNPLITYTDKEIFHPLQIIGLRFQLGHVNSTNFHSYKKDRADSEGIRLFDILFSHEEIKIASNGNKITEIQVT